MNEEDNVKAAARLQARAAKASKKKAAKEAEIEDADSGWVFVLVSEVLSHG